MVSVTLCASGMISDLTWHGGHCSETVLCLLTGYVPDMTAIVSRLYCVYLQVATWYCGHCFKTVLCLLTGYVPDMTAIVSRLYCVYLQVATWYCGHCFKTVLCLFTGCISDRVVIVQRLYCVNIQVVYLTWWPLFRDCIVFYLQVVYLMWWSLFRDCIVFTYRLCTWHGGPCSETVLCLLTGCVLDMVTIVQRLYCVYLQIVYRSEMVAIVQRLYCVHLQVVYLTWWSLFRDCIVFTYRLCTGLTWWPLFRDCIVFTNRLCTWHGGHCSETVLCLLTGCVPDMVAIVQKLYCVYLQVVYLTWWPLFRDCIVFTYRLCTWHGGHCSETVLCLLTGCVPDMMALVQRLYCAHLQVVYLTWWPLFRDYIVFTYRLCTWHGGHCSETVLCLLTGCVPDMVAIVQRLCCVYLHVVYLTWWPLFRDCIVFTHRLCTWHGGTCSENVLCSLTGCVPDMVAIVQRLYCVYLQVVYLTWWPLFRDCIVFTYRLCTWHCGPCSETGLCTLTGCLPDMVPIVQRLYCVYLQVVYLTWWLLFRDCVVFIFRLCTWHGGHCSETVLCLLTGCVPDMVTLVQRLYCVYLQVVYLTWWPWFRECIVFTYRLCTWHECHCSETVLCLLTGCVPDMVVLVQRLYCVHLQVVYLTWWPLFRDCIVFTYMLCTWHGGHCSETVLCLLTGCVPDMVAIVQRLYCVYSQVVYLTW